MRYLWWTILCALGLGGTPAVCWFSLRFFNVHDYPARKGGDGQPTHFYTYHCTRCGSDFII